jgi:hypothetical protein
MNIALPDSATSPASCRRIGAARVRLLRPALDAHITAPIGAQRTICVKSALKCISAVDNAMTRA